MIDNIEYLPGVGASDHVCLQFNFICYSSPMPTDRPKYNLHQADFNKMRELLQPIATASQNMYPGRKKVFLLHRKHFHYGIKM